jgi:hypothetical protein
MELKKIIGFKSFSDIKRGFYGNPTLKQKKVMETPDALWDLYQKSGLWDIHITIKYPTEEKSIHEIHKLASLQKLVNAPGDIYTASSFIKSVEEDHAGVWFNWLNTKGKTVSKEGLKKFMDSTDSILFKLKYYFQRPRPSQFAYVHKIPFFPFLNSDADSPAYPSGHALDAYKTAYAIGKKFPDIKKEAEEFSEKTAYTRIVGGVHYPSDHTFSKKIFEDLKVTGVLDAAISIYPF